MQNVMVSKVFNNKVELSDIIGMVVEQMGFSHDVKENIKQELMNIKQGSELAKTMENEHIEMRGKVKEFEAFKNESEKKFVKVEDFTECLFNHRDAKRSLENYIHKLTYRFTGEPTDIKDKLFHSTLTRNCKGHISSSLNASNFDRIKVSDVETAKRLAECHMTQFQVQHIISETIKKWQKEKANGTLRNKAAVELLDKYLNQESEKYADDLEEKLKMM